MEGSTPFLIFAPSNNKAMNKAPQLNHTEYMKKVKTLSDDSLLFIIKDANEAMAAMPDNPKNGWYADEVNYCSMEISRRKTTKTK